MIVAAARPLPPWLKQRLPDNSTGTMLSLLREFSLHTVCEEAGCPNIADCFCNKEFTFLILGNTCTRHCLFCKVEKSARTVHSPDGGNLKQVGAGMSRFVRSLNLRYVVITSVTRDDLSDGGAAFFTHCVKEIKEYNKGVKIEVLIPDFQGSLSAIKVVSESGACVLGHNIETVPRLYHYLRPQADYARSLEVLKKAKDFKESILTKSSLILGMGEDEAEVIQAMRDLRKHRCDILVLGQYLRPSVRHYPVKEFITPERFQEYRRMALSLGFRSVLSTPKARSSYKAEEIYNEAVRCTI
ncbi:MAG: lipoyl synthase [Candidatus Omnitrophica bacterium]|nr:lipoyl synthase [Candidatus Omnitrophota bacterium]